MTRVVESRRRSRTRIQNIKTGPPHETTTHHDAIEESHAPHENLDMPIDNHADLDPDVTAKRAKITQRSSTG